MNVMYISSCVEIVMNVMYISSCVEIVMNVMYIISSKLLATFAKFRKSHYSLRHVCKSVSLSARKSWAATTGTDFQEN